MSARNEILLQQSIEEAFKEVRKIQALLESVEARLAAKKAA